MAGDIRRRVFTERHSACLKVNRPEKGTGRGENKCRPTSLMKLGAKLLDNVIAN